MLTYLAHLLTSFASAGIPEDAYEPLAFYLVI